MEEINGNWVKKKLKETGTRNVDLANYLGIHRNYINEWKREDISIRKRTQIKIKEFFDKVESERKLLDSINEDWLSKKMKETNTSLEEIYAFLDVSGIELTDEGKRKLIAYFDAIEIRMKRNS